MLKKMKMGLGNKRIFLDSAIFPPTIYAYLKSGFRIVATPKIGQRTASNFLRATTYSSDEILNKSGLDKKLFDEYDAVKKNLFLVALLVRMYHMYYEKTDKPTEAYAFSKMKEWPETGDAELDKIRSMYLKMIGTGKTSTLKITGPKLKDTYERFLDLGVFAENPETDEHEAILADEQNYEFYFSSALTMRFDGDKATQFNSVPDAQFVESRRTNEAGLPEPITQDLLRNCKGNMEDQAAADVKTFSNLNDETGTRYELRMARKYAELQKTKIYAYKGEQSFWVAVEL